MDGSSFASPSFSTATATIQARSSASNSGTVYYETEMLALSISGGTLPNGVMLRESPTLASTGKTAITPDPGGYRISSFFDVFTEMSVDGGSTWSPAEGSIHLQVDTAGLGTPEIKFGSNNLPPASSRLLPTVNKKTVSYRSDGGGATVGRANFDVFTCPPSSDPPPGLGDEVTRSAQWTVSMSLDLPVVRSPLRHRVRSQPGLH